MSLEEHINERMKMIADHILRQVEINDGLFRLIKQIDAQVADIEKILGETFP